MATKNTKVYTCPDTGEVVVGYDAYLKTPHWKNKRQEFFASEYYHGGCATCDNPAEVIHHKNYDTVGDETLKCLVALCRDCHHKIHDIPLDSKAAKVPNVSKKKPKAKKKQVKKSKPVKVSPKATPVGHKVIRKAHSSESWRDVLRTMP